MRPIEEQTILITGATDGLGRWLAARLAADGAHVLLHGRNAAKLEQVRASIGGRTDVLVADLADLAQVDALADRVLRTYDRLDVLVSNAGVGFGGPGEGRQESADGVELRFAVNHLAGYHLTGRLLPLLRTSAPARVVNVASAGQVAIDFADPMLLESYDGVTAYRRSKLAQIMSTVDLAAGEKAAGSGVTVNALHPATFMATTMVTSAGVEPVSTVEQGGAATLRLIADPALDDVSGAYFDGVREADPDPQAADPAAREQLRELSDRLIREALGGPAEAAAELDAELDADPDVRPGGAL